MSKKGIDRNKQKSSISNIPSHPLIPPSYRATRRPIHPSGGGVHPFWRYLHTNEAKIRGYSGSSLTADPIEP